METKKTAISSLTKEARAHYDRVFPHASVKEHGKKHKHITRRTDKKGNVDYIVFYYGAIRTKQGIQPQYEPLGANYDFKRVGNVAQEKEWFAAYCLTKFGAPTPNA